MGQDDLAGGTSRAHRSDSLSGLLDREAVGDVDAEFSRGHELHRTPQVAMTAAIVCGVTAAAILGSIVVGEEDLLDGQAEDASNGEGQG